MRAELKRTFSSPLLYFTMFLFFICLQGYSFPSYYRQWLSDYCIPIEYRESALTMTLGSIFFGGAILLLPFFASAVSAPQQVDDQRYGIIEFALLRSSFRKYITAKCLCAFISGFFIASIAFCLHAITWNILTVPYDPIAYPEHGDIFMDGTLFSTWANINHGILIYLSVFFGIGFTAGIWAVVGLATATWIPDKLLAVIIPMCMYKLWNASFFYYLFGIFLPDPSTLFNDGQTLHEDIQAIIAYLVLFFGATATFAIGVRKKVRHE